MSWPLSQDYNEAIQDPQNSFRDPELRAGAAAVNALGLPMPRSGNFADVYEFRCPQTGNTWALKCFTRHVSGLQMRYAEISQHLAQANLPFTVDFTYLHQGIRVRGEWYPLLKMRWVEGFTLNEFIRNHLDKPQTLDLLCQLWVRLARRLREANVAHADLQHGNVLLVPSRKEGALSVKLIDYDGMWVPTLASTPSGEVGHPAYQHPQRLREGTYSPEVDRFPHLAIFTALRAVCVGGRALWEKYDNGDNLLFRETDLRNPRESALFRELIKLDTGEVRMLADRLSRAAAGPLEKVPLLDELLPEMPAAAATAAAPAPPASAPRTRPAPPLAGTIRPGPERPKPRRHQAGSSWGCIAGAGAVGILGIGGVVAAMFVLANLRPPATSAEDVLLAQKRDADTGRQTPPTPPTPAEDSVPTSRSSGGPPINSGTPMTTADTNRLPTTELSIRPPPEPKPPTEPKASTQPKPDPNPPTEPKTESKPPPAPPAPARPGTETLPVVNKKAGEKLALPENTDLVAAEKEIKDVYIAEYARKKPEDIKALAAKLFQDGVDTKDKPAAQFVLLREARDQGARAGELELALRAAAKMAELFAVDAAEMRAQALEQATRAATTAAVPLNSAAYALAFLDDATDADDYPAADRLRKAAQAALGVILNKALSNRSLEALVQYRAYEIQALRKAYEALEEKVKVLAANPDDPDANLALGKFFCLDKGDWDRGLPLLALGGDPKWKELAQKDLAFPADPAAQEEVGNSYAAWAKGDGTPHKLPILRRARSWYEQARAGSSGVTRTQLEKKLAALEKTAPPTPPTILYAAYGNAKTWVDLTIPARSLLVQSKDQKLVAKTDAGVFGVPDPVPFVQKALVIVYRYQERVRLSITFDGETVTIPPPELAPVPPAPAQPLTILYARFGSGNGWADETAKAQRRVKEAKLTVRVEDLFLTDPAFGKHKALVLVYRNGGKVLVNITPDGEAAVLPAKASSFVSVSRGVSP
jgi:hypothetical protein